MLKLFSIILFLGCILCSNGQEKTILGSIKNSENIPVPYANIVVSDTTDTKNYITYAYGDDQGNFSLEIPSKFLEVIVNVTAVGYEEKSISVSLNSNEPLIIFLEESVTQLGEIVVKARKLTDTLNIDTDDMNLNKASTLRELLNKTDGIILSEEDGISYQGKQINKVLINGKEVFVDQNKIALDNLNFEIMNNIQIIDNYKDKFTLDFKRIRDPVINIETKSEFKGILKTKIDVGYGIKNKYGLNAKGYFFSDKINAFATSHTNNVGEIRLSEKDVTVSTKTYATEEFNNTLYPFFIEDYQTTKNFVTNNSLTLRWQGLNSKTGVVVYHGDISRERKIGYKTFIGDTLIRDSDLRNNEKGSFISTTANYSHILSPKTVLQNVFGVIGINYRRYNKNMETLFVPNTTFFNEQDSEASENFTISNDFKITHLLSDNSAFNVNLDYYYEKVARDYETELTNIDIQDIFQQGGASKSFFRAQGNLNFRFRRLTVKSGIAITNNIEQGDLNFLNSTHENSKLKRKIFTLETPININGSINKLDYSLSATPTLINTDDSDNRKFLKSSNSLTYNFEPQNNLILRLNRSYRFYDVNSLFDTIVRSYNQRLINNPDENLDRYSVKEEIALSWINSNVARSKNIRIEYRFTQEQNFLESVLDSISNNVFYYSNKVFDKNKSHSVIVEGKKGIYLGSAYHRLDIGGGLNYLGNKYSTLFNSQSTRANITVWEPKFFLNFLPRKYFIKEMTNEIKWNHFNYKIGQDEITEQSIITNTFTVRGHEEKINWKFDFEHRFYDVDGDRFSVPDCNLSFLYDVTDKLSFSLVGKSLLTLFQLNNYNFASTLSNGNTFTQTRTDNNLGYLILYTSFKF